MTRPLVCDFGLFIDYLMRATRRSTLVVIGSIDSEVLASITAENRILIEESNIAAEYRWGSDVLVVAVDVTNPFQQPDKVAALLKDAYEAGSIVVTILSDMAITQDQKKFSAPEKPKESYVSELVRRCAVLNAAGLTVDFAAATTTNKAKDQPRWVVTLHDPRLVHARGHAPQLRRPLCIISMFNEQDVAAYVIRHFLSQGCDVHIMDNWSTDKTFEIVGALTSNPQVTCERFPSDGPREHYEFRGILQRKEEIALAHAGRWIIHADADEILLTPWPDLTLAEGFALATAYGANRVDFTLICFRPVSDAFRDGFDLQKSFRFFEFGQFDGHFVLKRAWFQGPTRIDLTTSGGHVACFDDTVEFPYKFLLKHYPIRSNEHGRRKVFRERQQRWSSYERDVLKWHIQYDNYNEESSFVWDSADLYDALSGSLLEEFGLYVISDLAGRHFTARSNG